MASFHRFYVRKNDQVRKQREILMYVSMFQVQAFADEGTEISASAEAQEPEETEEAEELLYGKTRPNTILD